MTDPRGDVPSRSVFPGAPAGVSGDWDSGPATQAQQAVPSAGYPAQHAAAQHAAAHSAAQYASAPSPYPAAPAPSRGGHRASPTPPPPAVVRGRGPRRARLTLTRLDPWSVLKATLVFSACLLVVFEVAVTVLYVVLDSMGVFSSVESTVHNALNVTLPFSALGIIGGAAVVGIVNVILVTALATVASFVYNLTAQLVGGLDVVLTETD